MRTINKYFQILSNQGIRWVLYRSQYELKKKIGWLEKKFPMIEFKDIDISSYKLDRFLDLFELEEIENNPKLIEKANKILSDKYTFFSDIELEINKIDWNYNYFHQEGANKKEHWSKISDLNSNFGDIKLIWELSRFTFSFSLAQAYVITKDEIYAAKFWDLFESFYKENPPERGVNYKCGQEMSLRLIAILYATNLMKDSIEFTEERKVMLLKLIVQHTGHIFKHINFSVESVKNNHSISEATALFVIGCVFSNKQWKSKGKEILEKEIKWQIYSDGSYIQHSHNYHRLVIQNLTLVKITADKFNVKFSKEFLNKCKITSDFLINHCNEHNGRVPNYGMNDGAYILPLTSLSYLDYRPALNAFKIAYENKYCFADKDTLDLARWLGLNVKDSKFEMFNKNSVFYEEGGYLVSLKGRQQLTARCTTYKHRPVQADMLHVDFWVDIDNILCDAGTYSYNTNTKDTLYFNGNKSHNSLFFDEKDQMLKGARFIWYNWIKSKVIKWTSNNIEDIFIGEHFGYSPLQYRRLIKHKENELIIEDVIVNNNDLKTFEFNYLCGIPIHKIEKNVINFRLSNHENWSFNLPKNKNIEIEIIPGKQSLFYNSYESRDTIRIKVKPTEKDMNLKISLKKEVL